LGSLNVGQRLTAPKHCQSPQIGRRRERGCWGNSLTPRGGGGKGKKGRFNQQKVRSATEEGTEMAGQAGTGKKKNLASKGKPKGDSLKKKKETSPKERGVAWRWGGQFAKFLPQTVGFKEGVPI